MVPQGRASRPWHPLAAAPGGARRRNSSLDALLPNTLRRLYHFGCRIDANLLGSRAGRVTAVVSAGTAAGVVAPLITRVAAVGRVAAPVAAVDLPTAATVPRTRPEQTKEPGQGTAGRLGWTIGRIAGRDRCGAAGRFARRRRRRTTCGLAGRNAGRATCRFASRNGERAAGGPGHGGAIARVAHRAGAKQTTEEPAAGAADQQAGHQAEKDDSLRHDDFPICASEKHTGSAAEDSHPPAPSRDRRPPELPSVPYRPQNRENRENR